MADDNALSIICFRTLGIGMAVSVTISRIISSLALLSRSFFCWAVKSARRSGAGAGAGATTGAGAGATGGAGPGATVVDEPSPGPAVVVAGRRGDGGNRARASRWGRRGAEVLLPFWKRSGYFNMTRYNESESLTVMILDAGSWKRITFWMSGRTGWMAAMSDELLSG